VCFSLILCIVLTAYNYVHIKPLNAELNPICYFLALLVHHFLHVSRIRVKADYLYWKLTLNGNLKKILNKGDS